MNPYLSQNQNYLIRVYRQGGCMNSGLGVYWFRINPYCPQAIGARDTLVACRSSCVALRYSPFARRTSRVARRSSCVVSRSSPSIVALRASFFALRPSLFLVACWYKYGIVLVPIWYGSGTTLVWFPDTSLVWFSGPKRVVNNPCNSNIPTYNSYSL